MSVDILKSCVNGFDGFAQRAAQALDEDDVANMEYNIKALTFDGSTVLGIATAVLTLAGCINPLVGLAVVGLSLLGRVVAQQSMGAHERGFAQIFNSRIPIPLSDRSIATFGNQVLFYDTVPSMRELLSHQPEEAC